MRKSLHIWTRVKHGVVERLHCTLQPAALFYFFFYGLPKAVEGTGGKKINHRTLFVDLSVSPLD